MQFRDDAHLMLIIDRIVSAIGRRMDESSPMVDARLADGSRVNAIIPPLALDGPCLSIRRFGRDRLTSEDLLRNHTFTPAMLELLRGCVDARLNIADLRRYRRRKDHAAERAVVFYFRTRNESSPSKTRRNCNCTRTTWCGWKRGPPNIEGKGAVHQRQLLINTLRMRPDRIVVGEVRGEEALDMLQAMNTGHDGSLTTIHANSPRDALCRMETMVAMASLNLPETAQCAARSPPPSTSFCRSAA